VTIDIMMPFYGDVGQFRAAVRSVLAQTDDDWRLVVIDDCYPGSEHVDFMSSIDDSRVTLVRNPRNLGVARSFQRSIELSRAPHLVIMGCDDLMAPNYVAHVTELLAAHPDADYVQPGVRVVDDEGRPVWPLADRVKRWYRPRGRGLRVLRGEDLATNLLRGNWTYFPSITWRRESIARFGFRIDYEVVLDLALQIDIALAGGVLVTDDEEVFSYRRHASSVSSATAVNGRRFQEERRFFFEAEQRCLALGWKRASRAAHHHWSSRLNALSKLPTALRGGDHTGARILLRHAWHGGTAKRSSHPT
jgi:glycosyltransferase involved in cell wall biosynthesis